MNKQIENFKNADNDLFLKFGIENKYFVSIRDNSSWSIINDDELYFVTFEEEGKTKTNLVVKKSEKPLIFEKDGYTMIIAIDCIKIAFVFKNVLKR